MFKHRIFINKHPNHYRYIIMSFLVGFLMSRLHKTSITSNEADGPRYFSFSLLRLFNYHLHLVRSYKFKIGSQSVAFCHIVFIIF